MRPDPVPSRQPEHGFQPLRYPLVFAQPLRLSDVDSWHEHIPFAFFAVAALRPRILVELGTWKGDSYSAFCQAVEASNLPTRCYAVDTWAGDVHTGPYGPDVLEELRLHHDPLYNSFSRLLQQTFDEAVEHFAAGSIDLLHVDGAHSYEAVAHDVETWLPKLSDRGVLLLHDTNVRDEGFGVWRLWDELSERYPGFAFTHGHGLGVLAVGPSVDEQFLAFLEAARADPLAARFFSTLGSRISAPAREQRARAAAEASAAQSSQATAEARSDVERLRAEAEWQRAETEQQRGEAERIRLEHDRLESRLWALEHELTDVLRSISWRLTSPLRTGKRDVRRIRNLVRRLNGFRRVRFARVNAAHAAPGSVDGLRSATKGPSRRLHASELPRRPLISIITPVYNTDPEWLGRAVESVRRQTYPNWQLCLVDDGSTNERTQAYLRSVVDPAIEIVYKDVNRGIAAATNRALESAQGEFVAFLDHDDELEPDALLECVRLLNDKPETDAIYTDEDKLDRRGKRCEPFFKPDWSPELFRGVMYVGHLLVLRRSLVLSVGGLDSTFDGVQDYELMLRVSEHTDRIEHIPRILYHWRKLPQSIASSTDAKDGISGLQAAAVSAHLERSGVRAFARPNPAVPHRAMLHPKPRVRWPRVTVIVPTKDAPQHLGPCLRSLFTRSTYPNFGVLLVDNGTTDPDARRLFDEHPVEVLPFDRPFNFSRVNNVAVAHVDSDFVVFLNNDTEIRTPHWLEVLVSLAELDGVGAVGPLLVYPDGKVQHAGVVLGLRGTADHIMRGFPSTADGYAGSLSCTREVSAVTAACMAIRRELFLDAGAFDEHFATHYQDVDLCLRLRRSGHRNLFTPRAVVRHDESATRGADYDHLDRSLLLDTWGETIGRGDPYYNPSLSLSGTDYQPREGVA